MTLEPTTEAGYSGQWPQDRERKVANGAGFNTGRHFQILTTLNWFACCMQHEHILNDNVHYLYAIYIRIILDSFYSSSAGFKLAVYCCVMFLLHLVPVWNRIT